jgi:hypothetical protein
MDAGAVNDDLRERNRRTLVVVLAVMAALVVATFLAGIRW